MNSSQLTQVQSLIASQEALSVLITKGTPDLLIAGLSLGLSLEKGGKKVFLFSPQKEVNLREKIVGLEKIESRLEKKDLTISLNYPLEKIDKVSSLEKEGGLDLVVKVKSGAEPIKPEEVKVLPAVSFPATGFVLGNYPLEGKDKKWFSEGEWIYLGVNSPPQDWAKISLIEEDLSFSALVAAIIQGLGLPLDEEVGGNLFQGIKEATRSFTEVKDYRTFEIAAVCFKVSQRRRGYRFPSPTEAPRIEEVEKKEGDISSSRGFPAPKIFKGATTPRI